MAKLARLHIDHLPAVLDFELENRTYFARSITDRGDGFYAQLADHHRAQLIEQDAGACVFHVLVVDDGTVLGRFNLYDLTDGSASVGYRVAESAAGRGVATGGVRELCRLASTRHGLRTLTAQTTLVNHASQRVLEKVGFRCTGACTVAGRPGVGYTLDL